MPSRNSIQVVINATDNASKVFDSVAGNIQSVGKAALAFGATAIAGATTSMVGLGIQSINTFKDFEKGMNEVFTLLPGISGDAMQEMENQVLSFNNAVGRTSSETIPALYQSLSAGVPQENVFSFLELANKAAVGGVTDLETAVDGISSAMNAYGSDVLGAEKASDIMFTTVRLGKTTFEELSASMFQVNPVAAALGVSFEETNAAIATITAQGVPTSVAMTQMRSALVELGDAGTNVSKVFMEASGVSFKEFIAQGGNTAEAMAILEKHAASMGIGINELFGSVEAGNAALALTGGNMEKFVATLDEMNNATGATETAFNQMNQGIQTALNKLFARWETLLINIGRIIAPILSPIIDIVSGIVEKVGNAFGSLADLLDPSNPNSFFAKLKAGVPLFNAVQATVARFLSSLGVAPQYFKPIAKAIGTIAKAFTDFITDIQGGTSVFEAFQGLLFQLGVPRQFIDAIESIGFAIMAIVDPIAQWFQENVKLQDVLMALGIAIASVVIPAILGIVAAFAPVIITFGLLVAGIAAFRNAWESDWMGIQTIFTNIWENNLKPAFDNLAAWLSGGNMDTSGIQALFTIIAQGAIIAGAAIGNFIAWFINGIPIAMEALNQLAIIIVVALQQASVTASNLWNQFVLIFITALQQASTIATSLWNQIKLVVISALFQAWQSLMGWKSQIEAIFQGILDWITTNWDTAWTTFTDFFSTLWTSVSSGIEAFKTGIQTAFNFIKDSVIQPVIDIVNNLFALLGQAKQKAQDAANAVTGALGSVQVAGQATQQIGSGLASGQYSVGDVFGAVGHAFGIGGRQFGGQVTAGKPYIVGEKRPEVFMPKSSGNIFPSLGALAGGIMSIAGKQARPTLPSPSQSGGDGGGRSRSGDISNRPIQITIVNNGKLSDEDANQNVYKLKRELQVQGFNVSGN